MPFETDTLPVEPSSAAKDPLDDEGFRYAVLQLIQRARNYQEDELRPRVEKAWRYFNRQVDFAPQNLFGKENGQELYEGSRVVIAECFDRAQAMLPELARVFLGGEETVAFVPMSEEDEPQAEQATDCANYVFRVQNDGENIILDGFLDWTIKYAAAKIYWHREETYEEKAFEGIGDDAMMALRMEAEQSDEIVELEAEAEPVIMPVPQPAEGGGAVWGGMPEQRWRGRIKRVARKGKIAIEGFAHEELLIDPDAQSIDEALIVGQDCYRTVSQLVAMGIPYEVVERHRGVSADDRQVRIERAQRNLRLDTPSVGDPAVEYVRVVEAVIRLDRDGDGVAERYRVLALGESPELVGAYPGDDVYYVIASPFRRPHEPIGTGIVEGLIDIQDIKTALVRGWVNNFNRANHPRELLPSDDADGWEDLKSWFGGPIRAQRPEAFGFHVVPFVGQNALPLLQWFDEVSAMRTGISPAGQGITPDALKGQTVETGSAIVTAPQARMEFLIREFATTFLRPVFRAILKLMVAYQDKPLTIRLRNRWVTMDPRGWNASMDAEPRVGLGTGTMRERMTGLQVLLMKQEMMLASGSPLVSLKEYREGLVELCLLLGRKNAARYFKEISDEQLAQQQQAQAAAAEEAKQLPIMIEQAKAQAKAAADTQVAQIKAQMEERLNQQELAMKLEVERMKAALRERELMMEAQLEKLKMAAGARDGQGDIATRY